jgi:hypothetical protein
MGAHSHVLNEKPDAALLVLGLIRPETGLTCPPITNYIHVANWKLRVGTEDLISTVLPQPVKPAAKHYAFASEAQPTRSGTQNAQRRRACSALWEKVRSGGNEACSPPPGSLTASGEIPPSMRRVIDGACEFKCTGNDERVGEKEIHRLLAIERENKKETQCGCPKLGLPTAHSAFTEAMLSAKSVGTCPCGGRCCS